ncbi:unnamed protein product, partial [Prorocentrum cordatum]
LEEAPLLGQPAGRGPFLDALSLGPRSGRRGAATVPAMAAPAFFNPTAGGAGADSGPVAPPARKGPREQSRTVIAQALAEGTALDPAEASEAIEEAIFEMHPDESKKEYRTKVKLVAQGLKGPRFAQLRAAVLQGDVTGQDVVCLDAKALQDKAAKAAKDAAAKAPAPPPPVPAAAASAAAAPAQVRASAGLGPSGIEE